MIEKYLEGEFVYLQEMTERDFDYVILWRNNTENNKFINQDFTLTYDLQSEWYERYIERIDEILYVIFDKKGNRIGTIGATDIDLQNHVLVVGRLLIGELKYRIGPYLPEACKLFYDYFFNEIKIEKIYGHVAEENKNARALDRSFGFIETNEKAYPNHLQVKEFNMLELVNTKRTYNKALRKICPILDHFKARNTNLT